MSAVVLRTLAAGGPAANKLATVIQRLALAMFDRDTGGDFEEYQYLGEAGELVTGRTFPRAWWPRLEKAIEIDALSHMPAKTIVDVMLQGPR